MFQDQHHTLKRFSITSIKARPHGSMFYRLGFMNNRFGNVIGSADFQVNGCFAESSYISKDVLPRFDVNL